MANQKLQPKSKANDQVTSTSEKKSSTPSASSRTVRKVLSIVLMCIFVKLLSLLLFHSHDAFQQTNSPSTNNKRYEYSDLDYLMSVSIQRNKSDTFEQQGTSAVGDKNDTLVQGKLHPHVVAENFDPATDEIDELCFPYNSKEWLTAGGKRFKNVDDGALDENVIANSILNIESLFDDIGYNPNHPLHQTLCHDKSRFVSFHIPEDEIQNPSNETINIWSSKLMYLATHIHQHLPALEEAQFRSQHEPEYCPSQRKSKEIGTFDFECLNTKYLVISLGKKGLGAIMRLGAVSALMAGIASNRTVVFVNKSPVGPRFLRDPWLLASCDRRDYQCFFMPTTPCVLTHQQIAKAPVLEKSHARQLYRYGTLSDGLEEHKVIILDQILRPQRTPVTFRQNLVNIVKSHIINPMLTKNPNDPRITTLIKAAEFMLEEEEHDGTYSYFGFVNKHNRALAVYAMRPNIEYSKKIDHIMEQTFLNDFNTDLAFGLPIRASDKCEKESECLPFHKYMTLMDRTWHKYGSELDLSRQRSAVYLNQPVNDIKASIIVTSEAPRILKDQKRYESRQMKKNMSFPFTFINNKFDLQQDTGNPDVMDKKFKRQQNKQQSNHNSTLDEIMLSSISSLKVQLHARYTIGNCCSNFHLLLLDFLKVGCGASTHGQIAECLQDNEDPNYRLCCEWSKTPECRERMKKT